MRWSLELREVMAAWIPSSTPATSPATTDRGRPQRASPSTWRRRCDCAGRCRTRFAGSGGVPPAGSAPVAAGSAAVIPTRCASRPHLAIAAAHWSTADSTRPHPTPPSRSGPSRLAGRTGSRRGIWCASSSLDDRAVRPPESGHPARVTADNSGAKTGPSPRPGCPTDAYACTGIPGDAGHPRSWWPDRGRAFASGAAGLRRFYWLRGVERHGREERDAVLPVSNAARSMAGRFRTP